MNLQDIHYKRDISWKAVEALRTFDYFKSLAQYIELEEVPRAFGESIIYPWVLKWNARHRPEAQNPEVSYGTMNNMTIYLWLTKQEEDILSGEHTDVVCEWNNSDGWPEEYKAPEGLRAPLIDMARLTRLKVK